MGSAEVVTSPFKGLAALLKRMVDAVVTSDKTPPGHASWMLFERLHNTRWVQRRVEEISVTGRRLVHRQVWVVVRIDPDDADEREGNERTAIVPLNQFRKKPDVPERVFYVRDEDDTVVPALKPEERDKRLVRVLLTAADRLPPNQSEIWRKLCQELVPATDPEIICERLASLEGLLGEMSKDGSDVADLRTVLRRVARHRFLLVPVKADGQSHCFSFEYISSDTFERSEDDDRHGRATCARRPRQGNAAPASSMAGRQGRPHPDRSGSSRDGKPADRPVHRKNATGGHQRGQTRGDGIGEPSDRSDWTKLRRAGMILGARHHRRLRQPDRHAQR